MNVLIIRFIAFLALTLHIHAHEQSAEEILYKNKVILSNRRVGNIEIRKGEEAADVVHKFGFRNGLDQSQWADLLKVVCNLLDCKRSQALIWITPATHKNVFIDNFVLYGCAEPVDAAHIFVHRHNLKLGYRHAIF